MRISRKTGAMSGFMLVVLGAWGGLIPFIGPYFGYAFGSHATWHFTTNRLWLDILPGVAVALGGLILMQSGHRASGGLGSWLAMAGGAWFAVGPAVSRLWEHGPGPIGAPLFGHTRQTFELIGYFYGLGAVVIGLAAFALGRFVTRPALVVEPVAADAVAAEPIADERRTAEPVTAQQHAVEPVAAGHQADGAVTEERSVARPITGGSSQNATTDSTAADREHARA